MQKFKESGVEGLARGYVNLEKLLGADGDKRLLLPDKDATDEDRAAFWNKLGRPEKVEGYDVKMPEKVPQGYPVDVVKPRVDGFLKKAHQIGITQAQAKEVVSWFMEDEFSSFNGAQTHAKQVLAETDGKLRKDLGKAYELKTLMADRLLEQTASEELRSQLKATGWNNNYDFVTWLIKLSDHFGEDNLTGDGKKKFDGAMTPPEAKSEIEKLKGDKKFLDAYTNRKDPGHKAAVKQMEDLHNLAYIEEK
jgi:hypothetical protein